MRSEYLQEDLAMLAQALHDLDFDGSSILITGATGLIGSLCLRAIIEHNKRFVGHIQATAMVRNMEKTYSLFEDEFAGKQDISDVCFGVQDVTEPLESKIHYDYIIHTASPTSSRFFMTNPTEVIDSIYLGTRNILRHATTHGASKIVYLSSMEVFGCISIDERCNEEVLGYLDINNVRSCYSEGKRHAELLCKCFNAQHGVPVCTARLAQTFGAGVLKTENRVFAQFARSAIRGADIVLHTHGLSMGNYCYTRDAIAALFLLLKKGAPGEVYNVVNEKSTTTIAEMAKLVAEKFSHGRSRVLFEISENNEYGYAPDTKLRLSAKKLRQLGWHPDVQLEEMYRRMLPDL